MEALTGNNLLTAAVVILAVVAAWNTIWAGVRNYREAKKPQDDLHAKVDAHQDMLDRDNKRLRELEDSNKLLLKAIGQLIDHEVDGNHSDRLVAVRNEINEYLINR